MGLRLLCKMSDDVAFGFLPMGLEGRRELNEWISYRTWQDALSRADCDLDLPENY